MALVKRVEAPSKNPKSSQLSSEEEHRLSRRWRTLEDSAALARLVESHLGLVISIANQFRHSGPSTEDLIQEGNLGLTVAARRFDPDAGTRLSTYASYWIRAFMLELVVRSHGPVRIGTTRAQRKIFFGLGRARRRLELHGEPVSRDGLARELGVTPVEVDSMVPRLSGHDPSFDAPRRAGDERELGSLLSDDQPNAEDRFADREEEDVRTGALKAALAKLDARERTIVRARHLARTPVTLETLGDKLRVSRERVRQLEKRAVAKLRKACSGGI